MSSYSINGSGVSDEVGQAYIDIGAVEYENGKDADNKGKDDGGDGDKKKEGKTKKDGETETEEDADGAKTTPGPAGGNLLMVGGAYKGNTVKTETSTITMDIGFEDAVGNQTMDITTISTTVSTEQHVNPDVLGAIDGANGNDGQGMLHETLESYIGGVVSLKKGKSSSAAGQPGSVYSTAHRNAPSQGGTVKGSYWDAAGNPLIDAAGAVRVEIKSKGQVVMVYP